MNKIFLIGNLTKDPETSNTNSGIAVCRFSIAVNRRFANQEGEREVDFINIVAWRGLAENCGKFLSKGKKVAVDGSLQIRNYDDKDGNKRTAVEVVADNVEFLTAKGGSDENTGNNNGGEKPSYKAKTVSKPKLEPVEDDDLPF